MNFLLDTCSFLWASNEPELLSQNAIQYIKDPDHNRFLSSASVWEVCLKSRLMRLHLPKPPKEFIPWAMQELNLLPLPVEIEAALLEETLPPHHKDPFDRMLICQAMHHNLTILTPDRLIQQYGVACLW